MVSSVAGLGHSVQPPPVLATSSPPISMRPVTGDSRKAAAPVSGEVGKGFCDMPRMVATDLPEGKTHFLRARVTISHRPGNRN
jgi:hypothetical protein